MSRIHLSDILTAFNSRTIGTKVTNKDAFLSYLQERLSATVFPSNGQVLIDMGVFLRSNPGAVTAGVAKRGGIPDDGYVVRRHRGECLMFAKRDYACTPESLMAIVYSVQAYCTDPEVKEAECQLISNSPVVDMERDSVLVAVIASVGPKPPVSSHRFVRNLAGGNKSYTQETGYTLAVAVADAQIIAAYEKDWIDVAD